MDRDESKLQLHEALTRNDLGATGELLSEGANINAKDPDERTLLHRAVLEDRGEAMVDFLLERGADVNARGEHNCTPIHLAARYGHLELVRLLVDHETNMNVRDDMHRGSLHYAANFDRL